MLRPYCVACLRPCVSLIWALADYDNPVHMVRHDHRDVQGNPGEVFRNFTPTLTRDPSRGTEAHASRHDLSEQMVTRSPADRHEVAPRTGVVEPDRKSTRLNSSHSQIS